VKDKHISKFVNDLFYDVVESDSAREQKEELRIHLTERVNDYMAAGLSFDEAFEAAKDGLGDPEELISGFERRRTIVVDELEKDYGLHIQVRFKRFFAKLVALSPFVYLIVGLTQNSWQPEWWTWGWWTWGWVIIPIMAILSSGIGLNKIPSISPFIYILLGVFLGWWAWGWLVIPIASILFSVNIAKKKKKKKKKKLIAAVMEFEKNGKTIKIDNIAGTVEVMEDGEVIKVGKIPGVTEVDYGN